MRFFFLNYHPLHQVNDLANLLCHGNICYSLYQVFQSCCQTYKIYDSLLYEQEVRASPASLRCGP